MKKLSAVCLFGALSVWSIEAHGQEFELLEHDIIKFALPKIKIGIKQAIDAAMKEAGDAKLAEAELSMDADAAVFELGFLTATGGLEISVDASTGKVLEEDEEEPEADEAEEFIATGKALNDAKVTLIQAIDVAMNEVRGAIVVAAEADVEDGKLGFEVEVVSGDEFKEVHIDANGRVTKTEVEHAEGQDWIFDHDETGRPGAAWKLTSTNPADARATWTIVRDRKAMSGPNVLTLDANSGGGVFNLAIAERTSYADVDVRTRIRPNSGSVDQGGGVIWRARDENNYYICRINPLEGNFRVYKVVSGRRTQLQGISLTTEPAKWYAVRAKMIGDHIQCFVNGSKLLDVTDTTFRGAGMVGLWTKADASSSFDNIAVKPAKASKEDQTAAKAARQGNKAGDDDDDDDDGD